MSHEQFHGLIGYSREFEFFYLKEGNVPHGFIKVNPASHELRRTIAHATQREPQMATVCGFVSGRRAASLSRPMDAGRLIVHQLALHRWISARSYELWLIDMSNSSLANWTTAEAELLEDSQPRESQTIRFPTTDFQLPPLSKAA